MQIKIAIKTLDDNGGSIFTRKFIDWGLTFSCVSLTGTSVSHTVITSEGDVQDLWLWESIFITVTSSLPRVMAAVGGSLENSSGLIESGSGSRLITMSMSKWGLELSPADLSYRIKMQTNAYFETLHSSKHFSEIGTKNKAEILFIKKFLLTKLVFRHEQVTVKTW